LRRSASGTVALFGGGLVIAACSGGTDDSLPTTSAPTAEQDVVAGETPEAAEVIETTSTSTTPQTPESTAAPTTVPGVFADDNGTELGVGVLVSWEGFGQVQSLPISVAVGEANQDIAFEGSPFEFGAGEFDAPFVLTDDGDLTADPVQLRESFVELLDGTIDLVIGPLPASDIAEFTDLAEAAMTPFVAPNYVSDGSAPSANRIDIAGSVDSQLDAIVTEVVAGEYPGIVVVGTVTDPNLSGTAQRFLDAGAAPLLATVPNAEPIADDLAEVVSIVDEVGEGVAVILVSPGVSAAVAQELAGSEAALFAGDISLSRTEVTALDGLDAGQLVVVRRVDDVRRPEQAEFADRLVEFDNGLESTFFSAESYDAYALAALATAQIGRAEAPTLAAGMIEASRTGEPCAALDVCFALIENGIDIDYDGWSGPIELDDAGVATATWFGVQVVDQATGGVASERFVVTG